MPSYGANCLYARYVLPIGITRCLYSSFTIYSNYLFTSTDANIEASLVEVLEVVEGNALILYLEYSLRDECSNLIRIISLFIS